MWLYLIVQRELALSLGPYSYHCRISIPVCTRSRRNRVLHAHACSFGSHCATNGMQYAEMPNCANATSRKPIHSLYETPYRTGITKRSDQKTVTFGNVIVGFYCTCSKKKLRDLQNGGKRKMCGQTASDTASRIYLLLFNTGTKTFSN